MKCPTHTDTEAVAICVHCGRAMCSGCTKRSGGGRLVCSAECAAASQRLDEIAFSTVRKNSQVSRVLALFCYAVCALFSVMAIFSYLRHQPLLGMFVGGAGFF